MNEPAASPPATSDAPPGFSVAVWKIVRRLREANDWRQEVDDVLAILGRALRCHRSILFHLRSVREAGFLQTITAYWVDLDVAGDAPRPALIPQAVIETDALLARLAREERQGKHFAGHTRDLDGFLREDFDRQRIRSFL